MKLKIAANIRSSKLFLSISLALFTPIFNFRRSVYLSVWLSAWPTVSLYFKRSQFTIDAQVKKKEEKNRRSKISDVYQNREIVIHSEKKAAISSNDNETIIEFWIVCLKRIIFSLSAQITRFIFEAIPFDWKIFEFLYWWHGKKKPFYKFAYICI